MAPPQRPGRRAGQAATRNGILHGADGAQVLRSFIGAAVDSLREHRERLDDLNVFPVADSDTGTNLYLTFADAAHAVDAVPSDADAQEVARGLSRGALVGARGNSGVIVGQYVTALLEALVDPADPAADASGACTSPLSSAARAAHRAVAQPVEGTVLTVAQAIGDAAGGAGPRGSTESLDRFGAALARGLDAGSVALGRTTEQLPVLRAAGVQDAGAIGLLIVLEALQEALATHRADRSARPDGASPDPAGRPGTAGRPDPADPSGEVRPAGPSGTVSRPAPADRPALHGPLSVDGEFEVMYLASSAEPRSSQVDGTRTPAGEDPADRLRAALSAVGESVAVVGVEGLWQVHVHTDRPLQAIAVAVGLGLQQRQVCVRHLARQSGVHGPHRPVLGLVAVTTAPGLVPDLARAGAVVLLASAGTVLTGELDRAVEDTGAQDVLVLAAQGTGAGTGAGAGRTARSARSTDGRPQRVTVVGDLEEVRLVAGAATLATLTGPATSVGAGAEPELPTGAVLRAVHAVRCAVVPDVSGPGQAEGMHTAVVPLLQDGAGVLTVVTAAATDPHAVAGLEARLAASHPELEVVVLPGERPGADVLLGVE